MALRQFYIPPEQVIHGSFTLVLSHFLNERVTLDVEMNELDTMSFQQLLKIAKKVGVRSTRRYSRNSMIDSIKNQIIFEIDRYQDRDYVVNVVPF